MRAQDGCRVCPCRRGVQRAVGGLWSLILLMVVVVALLAVPGVSQAKPSGKPFEIAPGSFKITSSTLQAGAHEDLTTAFDFKHNGSGQTVNDLRTVAVNLPAGFTGSSTATPTCTQAQLLGITFIPSSGIPGTNCPPDSQVGIITVEITAGLIGVQAVTAPVYNMELTTFGLAAQFGFKILTNTVQIDITVRPGDTGITATSPNIEKVSEPHGIVLTFWGLPASKIHDAERGLECIRPTPGPEFPECFNGGEQINTPVRPFLSNPTSCGPMHASIEAESWEEAGTWAHSEVEVTPTTGCERVHFDPTIEATPTTRSAESSSGLIVSLGVPQTWENPDTLATSNLKDVTVALPEGYTVNPSQGSGLAGCTPAQYEAETSSSPPGAGCPPESKLGTVEIETPVLAEKIDGNVYLAKPFDNPFDSLLALYVVAKAPDRGVIVKTAGKVTPDPVTGRLTSTFENTPQQPFSHFFLKFRQGAASPLVSPPACGTYTILADFTPWSAPEEPRFQSNSFQIEDGVGGGPCPSGGVPPFNPRVISGTQNNNAGNYSPFYLRIVREDGEQEITKFTTVLPPGLTGNLSGIPFCPDAAIQAARSRTGQQELSEPSCPAASKVGHTLVGAGVGSVLAWTPGSVYLAGPYHGAPLSLVSVTSATVGPFDLGTVVIRFALRINPLTAQVEVDATGSDPIPHIIDGIVVHVRDIHVYVDRSKFMIDPTSCEHMSISNTITGAGADPANSADQQSVSVTTPFQAADCANLAFKPSFKVSTSGKTSRSKGASLTVKLTYPSAPQGTQANIRSVKVDLPKQLPSRLTTLQKACPDATFNANPAACPAASIVGHATAITPILPVPLIGPAYFVSHGGAKFPELIVVLQGYGFTIELHGETFINKEGVTSSTFHAVPDQPVTIFELTLPQGPDSALAANGNLCSLTRTVLAKRKVTVRVKGHKKTVTRQVRTTLPAALAMPTAFTAQNGMTIKQSTPITVTGCGKARKAKASGRGKRHGRKGGRG